MAIKFRIQAGLGALVANAANTIARLGVCAGGVAAMVVNGAPQGVYQYDAGQDVTPDLVAGPLAVDAQFGSVWGAAPHIAVKVPATTAGTISAVSKNGDTTSPTPTVVGSAFDSVTNSPYDEFNVRMRYSTGGAPGAAVVDVALDSASYSYTYPMPAALPAAQRGTVDVTGITWSTLDNLTLVFTADTSTAGLHAAFASQLGTLTQTSSDLIAAGVAALATTPRHLLFTTAGGTPSDVPANVVITGTDASGAVQSETLVLSQIAGTVRSAHAYKTITSLAYPVGQGTGGTVAIGYGGTVTVTFPSTVAGESDVLGAFTDDALVAAFVQDGDHRYLEVRGVDLGASGSLVAGNGTADAALGFTNATSTTGTDSTLKLPGTGLTVTFPPGVYKTGAVHGFNTTAPRHSKADFDTALEALNQSIELDFGLAVAVQEPVDGTDLASYVGDADTTAAAWEAQPARRFTHFIVPAPRGLADSAVKAALISQQSRYTTVAARWVYQTAPKSLPQGSFPRSTARVLAARCAAVSFSEDPGFGGFGPLPGCSMIGPDGVSRAPNEDTCTTKLGTSKGPGFTVVKAKVENGRALPYFVRGVTRAGAPSLFVDLGVTRMTNRAATIIYAELQRLENLTLDLNPDGTLQEHDAVTFEARFLKALEDELVPAHASAIIVAIDRTQDIAATRNLSVTYTVQERGQGEDITATLTLVGELVTDGQISAAA